MAWAIAVLAVGGMAAAGFEIWLAMRQHPQRFLYAWLAWTPLAFLGVFAGAMETQEPIASGLIALMMAPFAYPIFRGLIWLRFDAGVGLTARQAEEAALDAQRMKYHAMDFGGVRSAPNAPSPPVPRSSAPRVDSPVALPSATSRLDRATRGRRPAWVLGVEMTLGFGVCAIALALYISAMIADLRGGDTPSDEEMIAATLELNGYGGPRVAATGGICADGHSAGYRWSALGSDGRACVNPRDGQVSLWIERKWDPPGR